MIDLRSDTVTRPTPGMYEAMMKAPVGDDVFQEDPSIRELEHRTADMFGKEAGLFFPTGVMCNQVAIKCHTQSMDEVICDALSHIYNSENGGWSFHSGVSIRLLQGDRGRFTAEDVQQNINPPTDWQPNTSLVCIENTVNKGGGSIWDFQEIINISNTCKQAQLKLHLDGARIFNALAETGETPKDYGRYVDSISICFSKGLGTPMGSVLVGERSFISKARKWRKAMGGGMRQVGIMAAACTYALEYHVEKLKDDHRRARALGDVIANTSYCQKLYPVDSNIVLFELVDGVRPADFIQRLQARNLLVVPFGGQHIRMVTHLDFNDEQLKEAMHILQTISFPIAP